MDNLQPASDECATRETVVWFHDMCCFSESVTVTGTHIFARAGEGNAQVLAYQMEFFAKEPLAMILPLPVAADTQAIRFINLETYPTFFEDLAAGTLPPSRGLKKDADEELPVVKVGSFDASFVPKRADFARLDARFRLPDGVWDQLPGYGRHGFAVFKLRPGAQVHPMAFEFPRADPKQLFFPTVHVHDRTVHDTAEFHHVLYCQTRSPQKALSAWGESQGLAKQFMDVEKSRGLIDPEAHCYVHGILGKHPNRDTYV